MMYRVSIEACTGSGSIRRSSDDMILIGDVFVRDGYWCSEKLITFPAKPWLVAVGTADRDGKESYGGSLISYMHWSVFNLAFREGIKDVRAWLSGRCGLYHKVLREQRKGKPGADGTGSTMSGLLVHESRLYVLHNSRSRLYLYRGGRLRQMTRDGISRRAACNDTLETDRGVHTFGGPNDFHLEIEPMSCCFLPGDCLLLCTDGVWNFVPDGEIAYFLSAREPADWLLRRASENGSADNGSYVLLRVLESCGTWSDSISEAVA